MVVTLGLVLTVGVLATTYSQQAFGQHNGVSQNGGNGGSGSNGAIGANGGNGSPNIPCVGGHRTLTANGHTLVPSLLAEPPLPEGAQAANQVVTATLTTVQTALTVEQGLIAPDVLHKTLVANKLIDDGILPRRNSSAISGNLNDKTPYGI